MKTIKRGYGPALTRSIMMPVEVKSAKESGSDRPRIMLAGFGWPDRGERFTCAHGVSLGAECGWCDESRLTKEEK